MHDIYISGTGHWKASHLVTNEEIVSSFNEYVRLYNIEHEEEILKGSIEALGPSSVEFIEKASGIKTRYLIDKKNCLDINVMKPILSPENPGKISILAEMSIHAAKEALDQAGSRSHSKRGGGGVSHRCRLCGGVRVGEQAGAGANRATASAG